MKEINILEAIQMPQLMIDMVTPVKDYEKYDFHVGMKCKIDGFPFELMSENGKGDGYEKVKLQRQKHL